MNQKLQSIPSPAPKDWSGPIATLSISFLDLKKELEGFRNQLQSILNGFAQKLDEIDRRTAPQPETAPEKVNAA